MKKIVIEFKLDDAEYIELDKTVIRDQMGSSFKDWIKNEVQSNLEYELDVSGMVSVQVKDIK